MVVQVESAVNANLLRAGRLCQAILRSAFAQLEGVNEEPEEKEDITNNPHGD